MNARTWKLESMAITATDSSSAELLANTSLEPKKGEL
jgi:hypothetical protein